MIFTAVMTLLVAGIHAPVGAATSGAHARTNEAHAGSPVAPNMSAQLGKLVWADEFNTNGRPNPANWIFENGFVRNQEEQWYQPQNAVQKDGLLIITARKESVPNPSYVAGSPNWKLNRKESTFSSACLETAGKHAWLYGTFEFKARFDPSLGLWPALWFKGISRPWPHCGEVDLMEYYHHILLANACWGDGTWSTARTPIETFYAQDPSWSKKFHVWKMTWDKDWIRMYVDDRLENAIDLSKTTETNGWNPFHHPLSILINMAVGATGGDTSKTKFPAQFEIDWVRVYQNRSDSGH